jgi:hypothetical protein
MAIFSKRAVEAAPPVLAGAEAGVSLMEEPLVEVVGFSEGLSVGVVGVAGVVARAGEPTVGGLAGGVETGDGATGDLAGDTLGAATAALGAATAALGAGPGAGAAIQAELNNPMAKTKQRSALNRAILSVSCCRRRIVQIRVTETVCSRSLLFLKNENNSNKCEGREKKKTQIDRSCRQAKKRARGRDII